MCSNKPVLNKASSLKLRLFTLGDKINAVFELTDTVIVLDSVHPGVQLLYQTCIAVHNPP